MDNFLSIDYKDWFINQKRIPDKTSEEATAFFEFHKKLAREGFMMNGLFINPFLYWHLNLWHTDIDVIDDKGFLSTYAFQDLSCSSAHLSSVFIYVVFVDLAMINSLRYIHPHHLESLLDS